MALNSQQVKRLAAMQLLHISLENEIAHLTEMLRQLSSDSCRMNFTFSIHNSTRCEEDRAKAKVQEVTEVEEAIPVFIDGHFRAVGLGINKTCNTGISYSFNECTSIRILNVVLTAKKAEKSVLEQEMEVLLTKINTPTTYLYTKGLF